MFDRPAIEPNVIYTREQAAHVLGVSLSTLKALIRTGQLAVSQPLGMRRVFIRGAYILDMLTLTERNGHDARNEKREFVGAGSSRPNRPNGLKDSLDTTESRAKRNAANARRVFDSPRKAASSARGVRR